MRLTLFKSRAKQLRRNPTDAERILWRHLRSRQISGYKFRRQEALGPYIVDFVCVRKNLIIELDGGQHSAQIEQDGERTKWLESNGFVFLRFWNNQVINELEGVKQIILDELLKK